jgi:hypothetical protein
MRNADFGSGRATVGLQLAPRNAPRFLLAAGARYAAVRRNYTDRATGQIYEVRSNPDPDPPSTVEIGDRLDYDSNELFLNMRWRQNERLLLFVDSRFEQASFLESYANTTSLESLDFRAVTVEPGLSVQLHRVARLAFSVSRTELDYLDQSSLDAAGFRVVGQTRRYEYTRYRLSLSVKPARRWNFLIGARSADRDDAYAGYYDYGAISSFISIDRQIGSRATLRVYGSYSDLTYDNATVSGDPTEQLLDSEVRTVLVRFDRKFGRRTAWFVESGARRTDSHDPVFANDSDWVLGGVQFRKR